MQASTSTQGRAVRRRLFGVLAALLMPLFALFAGCFRDPWTLEFEAR